MIFCAFLWQKLDRMVAETGRQGFRSSFVPRGGSMADIERERERERIKRKSRFAGGLGKRAGLEVVFSDR